MSADTSTAPVVDEFGRTKTQAAAVDEDEAHFRDKLLARRQQRNREDDNDNKTNAHDDKTSSTRNTAIADDRPRRRRQEEETIRIGSVYPGRVVRLESYGAFVDLVASREEKFHHRGLVHISQMAPYRVETVQDVVQLHQNVFCKVLDIDKTRNRISLSLIGINQETGQEQPPQQQQFDERRGDGGSMQQHRGRGGGGRGRGRGPAAVGLERRAQQRLDEFWNSRQSWDKQESQEQQENAPTTTLHPSFLRELWSASPEPPPVKAATSTVATIKKRSKPRDTSSSNGSSSDSESSSSSSSSSESSADSRRRRKGASRRGGRRRGRHDDRRSHRSSRSSRAQQRKRRRSRRYSSSSSSSSSDSSSGDSDSSSSSSSASSQQEEERKRRRTDKTMSDEDKSPVLNMEEMNDNDIRQAQDFKAAVQGGKKNDSDSEDSEEDEGPQPLPQSNAALEAGGSNKASSYGKALLPGEGQAIAQYVQQNLRVPRRGEIGYSQQDIEKYENSGYVMSGSRHARMNAVRIRKENQVYSAEEQRALALITMEEKQQKEAALMEDFRTMLKEKEKAREGKSRKS